MAFVRFFQALRPITLRGCLRDGAAGVSLAAVNIPQVLGYARIAQMPLATGLYTALLAPIVFALVGSSRHLVVAADFGTAAILAGSVSRMAAPESAAYVSLVVSVTLCTAVMLLLARLFKLGFLADFLSRTVLVGFLAGVGVQVGVAMTGDMLGIAFGSRNTLIQLWELAQRFGHANEPTAALSLATVVVIFLGRRFAPRAPLPLVAVVAAIVASQTLGLAKLGVAVVGPVRAGLPAFGWPHLTWALAFQVVPIAASCFVVIIAQSAATARAYAERYDEALNEDDDILGLAAANVASAAGGAFVVNGSPTQTAMAERVDARSQLAQIVFAVTVLVVLLTLVGPLQALPRCVLAGLIFTIAVQMIDVATLRAMRKESPGEFLLALTTAAAVAGVGVEQGVLLAVGLSLLRHVRHSYEPHTAVLKEVAGGWLEAPAAAGEETEPGLVLYRFGADLFYANAHRFADEVRALVDGAPHPVRWLLIEADAITDLDYSAARTLRQLLDDLHGRDVAVAFARVGPSLKADMVRHGVVAAIGEGHILPTRHEALALVHGGG